MECVLLPFHYYCTLRQCSPLGYGELTYERGQESFSPAASFTQDHLHAPPRTRYRLGVLTRFSGFRLEPTKNFMVDMASGIRVPTGCTGYEYGPD